MAYAAKEEQNKAKADMAKFEATARKLADHLFDTSPFKERAKDFNVWALALPTEESAEIALRTQQVLAEETGVTKTVDPLGGSYYVESLTDEFEVRASEWLERIDSVGGMAAAIELGIPQSAIADNAYEIESAIDRLMTSSRGG
jgi:hypothetical protein